MSVIGSNILAGASGAAGGGSKVYVDDVFSTFLYTGNSSARSIDNGLDLSGEGGLVWLKARNQSYAHFMFDTERGTSSTIGSDSSGAAYTSSRISSFNNNGFSLTNDSYANGTNNTYASWTFRKAPGFFDVVTYTGNGVDGRTIAHNLGSVPGMIIIKNVSEQRNWAVYHRSLGATHWLKLDSTASANDYDALFDDTEPTSSVFTVGWDTEVNESGKSFVAYVFAHDDAQFGTDGDESIIKCGSYTSNGSEQEINLGFEPQFVLIKSSSNTGGWYLFDSMRGIFTGSPEPSLQTQESNAEAADNNGNIALTATGFRTDYNGGGLNASPKTYIYMAIRRPNKPLDAFDPPLDATDVFQPDLKSSNQTITTDFPVDLCVVQYTGGGSPYWIDRMRGIFTDGTDHVQKYLNSSSTAAQGNDGGTLGVKDFDSTSYEHSLGNYEQATLAFKRAPGFFDVVAYNSVSGGGVSNSQNHNLGVAPEMIIVKKRDAVSGWPVYHSAVGLSRSAKLNSTSMDEYASGYWESAPTSTQFFPYGSDVNNTGSWIAYLFATLPGISKVGSYTGTGNAINVDCGFTAGARFILIKRTDSSGDWYYWTSELGIVSGNDPYLTLNSSYSKVTNTDYIDPNVYGFTVTASAPAALNATGGTYLFLAIA